MLATLAAFTTFGAFEMLAIGFPFSIHLSNDVVTNISILLKQPIRLMGRPLGWVIQPLSSPPPLPHTLEISLLVNGESTSTPPSYITTAPPVSILRDLMVGGREEENSSTSSSTCSSFPSPAPPSLAPLLHLLLYLLLLPSLHSSSNLLLLNPPDGCMW